MLGGSLRAGPCPGGGPLTVEYPVDMAGGEIGQLMIEIELARWAG